MPRTPQASSDYAFESLGGDKQAKFTTAREELIEGAFQEVDKLGEVAAVSCRRLIFAGFTRASAGHIRLVHR